MKLLNKLVAAFISGALAIGVGVAIVNHGDIHTGAVVKATEGDVAYTLSTPKSNKNTAYASYYNVSINGISWNVPGNQNFDGYWRIGGKSLSNVDRTLKSNTSIDKAVKEIQVAHNGVSNTSLKFNSLKLTVASDAAFASAIDVVTISSPSTSAGTIKINPTTLASWPADSYYKFDFNFNNSTSKNYGLDLTQIDFIEGSTAVITTYATGIDLSIADADTIHTIDENDTITLAKDSENGTAVIEFNVEVSPSDASNKGYSWSCNATDNSVITYTDEPEIAVDTSKEGNYTLTVIASGSETAGAVSKTIYINVEESNVPTLVSVSVSGTPTKDTQYVGDAFDYSGLTFTAHYSDNSTQTVNGSDISWNALVAGENPTGTYNDVTVTVSSVTVVQGAFSDIAGIGGTTQYITATENGNKYYLQVNGTTSAPSATTNKGEATAFNVTLTANDTYQFESNGKYLYCTNDNNGIRFGTNLNRDWLVTGPTANKTGSFTVKNTTVNRFLSLYNLADFRSYNSATATNRHVNTDFETSSSVTGLTITAAEGAQTRFLKDSTFDPVAAGYSASLNYSNGTSEDVTSVATWTLDTSTVTNSAVITASYSGESATIENITIYEVVATKLVFNLSNMKISYATGETLNTEGLVVIGLDDNDQVVIDSCELSDCTFTPTLLSTAGTQTITVVYTNTNGATATGTFEVTVADELMYIKVTSVEDITFGDSYVFGVENNNKKDILMSGVTGTNKYIDGVQSSAITTDFTGVKAGELENTVHPFTLVKAGEDGIAMFDLVTNKFIEGNSSNYAYLKDAYTGNCKWSFSFTDGHLNIVWATNTERVFGYNVGSPRFSTYKGYANFNYNMTSGTAHLVLYKLSGSSVKSSVESFNTGSLLMNQYVGDNSYNADRCTDNYAEMKAEFVELSEAARMLFLDGTTFAEAYARFNAWCVANGQEYDSTLNVFSAKQGSRFTVISDSSTTTIVVICSLLTLSTIAVYFSVRKKKEI